MMDAIEATTNKLRVLDLFAGIGGFSLGLERTGGFTTTAFCEIEEFPRRVLAKHWPGVPIYHDVTTADFSTIGPVDLVTAGFPCQDVSLAGAGAGLSGERSGLFWQILRTLRVVGRPKLLLENVAELLDRGMGAVLGSLAQIGYDATWNCIPACAVGAPQERDRVWIVAHPCEEGSERPFIDWGSIPGGPKSQVAQFGNARAICGPEWAASFPLVSMGDGLPRGLVRGGIECAGNAVIPQIPEMIGRAILEAEA